MKEEDTEWLHKNIYIKKQGNNDIGEVKETYPRAVMGQLHDRC